MTNFQQPQCSDCTQCSIGLHRNAKQLAWEIGVMIILLEELDGSRSVDFVYLERKKKCPVALLMGGPCIFECLRIPGSARASLRPV